MPDPIATAISPANHAATLRRVRWLIGIFIIGLVLSGITAIPIQWQLDRLLETLGLEQSTANQFPPDSWQNWLLRVRQAVAEANVSTPFLGYAGDWLAFGHFGIAIVFIWAIRNPIRHRFLLNYGLILCFLVIPFALIFGHFRGIPLWWRAIDCTFGVAGAIPLAIGRHLLRRIDPV